MKKITKILLFLICLTIIFSYFTFFAIPKTQAISYQLKNPLENLVGKAEGTEAVSIIIGQVIKLILGIIGAVALLMFVYGGFTWLTSAGSGEKVEKGKNILIWSVIGLIVILTSYVAVSFIINALTGK